MSADPVPPSPAAPGAGGGEPPAAPGAGPVPDARGTGAFGHDHAHGHGHGHGVEPSGRRLAVLTLTALGVVYGDIGTSPLYAMRECFHSLHGVPPTVANVYGVLSLIVWALILVVTLKYITYILRADNRGEGGILALLALILQRANRATESKRRETLVWLGLFGAALLYGDGVITPAMSVLGAVEGIEIATPSLTPYVWMIAIVILVGLFSFQRFGTDKVGKAFGPIMVLWFGTIAALGVAEIVREPVILRAINPWYGAQFFIAHGFGGFVILGAVVLVVTGGEALYADMGHFGRRPIRVAWLSVVFPCLLLNYFGQGALLLRDPSAAQNPFYLLAPRALLYPLLVIATLAAIVASQALISGAFSLTQQSVQLGFSPRVQIVHTSKTEAGQIYIPEINKLLMLGCVAIVIGFRNSSALGAAYGIAVTGTMAITTVLFYQIERHRWHWPLWKAAGLAGFFLVLDLAFFGANALKIAQGGWVPLAIAVAIFLLMTTWQKGRKLLHDALRMGVLPIKDLLEDIGRRKTARVPGTAVFMTSDTDGTPVVLLHHLKHNKVLHEQVVLLSVTSADVPEFASSERHVTVEKMALGFFRVEARYGFMETPNVPDVMQRCAAFGLRAKPMDTTYYLGRERLVVMGSANMLRSRKKLFAFMARNARSATEFFGIPSNRVVELGTQVEF